MPSFPIVDTHVHLYDPGALPYSWTKGSDVLDQKSLPDRYFERTAPVEIEALVFVEVDIDAGHHLDEARFITRLADTEPKLRGMVGHLPMTKGAAIAEDLEVFAGLPLARGVRDLIQKHADEPGWCLQPAFVEAVKLLPRYGLSFDICLIHPQMQDAIELVKRCPDTRFVLDHIGKPGIKAGAFDPWRADLKALAELPNVSCKISGVATEADHAAWTEEQLAPYIAHAIESFGFDRVMFGGDWPVSELAIRYAEWVAIVDRVVAGASEEEKRKLFRDNAIAFYRL